MAVSILSCPSLTNQRTSLAYLPFHSSNSRRGFVCLWAHLRKQKSFIRLYMISAKSIPRCCMVETFSCSRSFKDVACQEDHAPSGISSSEDTPRSQTLANHSSNVNDFERELQELFTEVKTMIKLGNKIDALDLLQANYEVVKEQINAGARGIEEAATLDIIALGYMAIGDLKLVESLLDMLSQIVDCLKDDQPLLDSVLIHMGSMYSLLGKFDKSMLVYQRVVDILERIHGTSSTFLVSPLLGMAKVLSTIGRAAKAVEVYHRAITILELGRGAESEDLVLPLYSLGNLLIREGKATEAETSFNRILRIYMKLYGEHDGRVGMALCSLAHVKCATGNADEAIYLYRKALEVLKDANHKFLDYSIIEKMRIDLAELLHAVGRGKEGREVLKECLVNAEEYKGKEHPGLVTNLLNLATSYSQSKDFMEAERLLRAGLEIMMKTMRSDDPSITFPMLHLAVTLYHLSRDEEAEELALKVLRIRERAFGKYSLPVGEALDCLISIQTRLGKADAEVLELLNRVLKIQERGFGYDSQEVMATLKKIVFYLDKLGRKDEKFCIQKRLSALRKKYKQMIQY